MEVESLVLAVVLGGLFGWILSKLPDKWVYVIGLVAIIVALVLLASPVGSVG